MLTLCILVMTEKANHQAGLGLPACQQWKRRPQLKTQLLELHEDILQLKVLENLQVAFLQDNDMERRHWAYKLQAVQHLKL